MHVFEITVEASLKDSDLISRILDFKEELHRECVYGGYAIVSDAKAVDRALAPLSFTVRSKRHLGQFSRVLKKALEHYDVGEAVRVLKH